MLRVTIGVPCSGDMERAEATIMALNLYHPIVREEGEIILIDNSPEDQIKMLGDRPCSTCQGGKPFIETVIAGVPNARYVPYAAKKGTAAAKNEAFRLSKSDVVIVIDSHVMIAPGAIQRIVEHLEQTKSQDLYHGPWISDSMDPRHITTHMDDKIWRGEMFGTWAVDQRAIENPDDLFEIPMHGGGLICCRREAWLGFSPHFRGFGGEEGYIHQKFRQAGRKIWCDPRLVWWHAFKKPRGVTYPLLWQDKLFNYFVAGLELKLPPEHLQSVESAMTHFVEDMGKPRAECEQLLQQAKNAVAGVVATEDVDGDMLPLVICEMQTDAGGNDGLADESIRAFLDQEYPNKLLVVSDEFDVSGYQSPEVINRKDYFGSSGEKLNWSDASQHLPWYLSQHMAMYDKDHAVKHTEWWIDDYKSGATLVHDDIVHEAAKQTSFGPWTGKVERRNAVAGDDSFDRVVASASAAIGDDFDQRLTEFFPPIVSLSNSDLQSVIAGKFPDRQNLTVCDFGREQTLAAALLPTVGRVYSVHRDNKPLASLMESLGPNRVKVKPIADVTDCPSCQLNENIDLLYLGSENPLRVLRDFRSIQKKLSDIAVIVVPIPEASCLIRTVLDPTHTSVRYGEWLVFSPRAIPGWMLARFRDGQA